MRPIALVLAIAVTAGCYDSEHHSPTDPVYSGAVQLSQSTASIQADGVSRVTITATLSPATSSANRAVTFKTTAGTFVGAASPAKETVANADASGLARVELRSSTDVEMAIVTATVSGVTQSITVSFTEAVPDDIIRVSTSASEMPADGFSRVAITAELGPAPSTSNRPVTFKTTAGTFVGAAAPAKEITVNADSAGIARVELRSSTDVEQAIVTASAGGVTRSATIAFTAPSPGNIIHISATANVVPADGETVIQVIAQVAAGLQSNQRSVEFTTSAGSFVKSGNQAVTETASLDNRAIVDLKAPRAPSNTRLTATVNGVKAEMTIAFVAALPQRIEVQAPFSIKANEEVTVTAKLFRTPGSVTRDRDVSFTAIDAAGNAVGLFHNVRVSADDGTATATYTPNGTDHRGPITIRASTQSSTGETIVGQASAVIVDPDPDVTTT